MQSEAERPESLSWRPVGPKGELATYRFGMGSIPLLCVHGFAGGGVLFSPLFVGDDISMNGDVVGYSYDQRGHGSSQVMVDRDEDRDPQLNFQWARDLHSVIDAVLDETKRDSLYLLGWSLGAVVIGEYISLYGSDSIAGVVLLAPSFSVGDRAALEFTGSEFQGALRSYLRATTHDDSVVASDLLASVLLSPGSDAERQRVLSELAQQCRLARRRMVLAHPYQVVSQFASLEVPVLIVHGDADRVVEPRSSKVCGEEIGAVVKIVSGCGHDLITCCLDDLRLWIARFLAASEQPELDVLD